MKVLITGSSGLAKVIGDMIAATPYVGSIHIINHARIEDLLMWTPPEWNEYDAFINCAHLDFQQCNLLMLAYEAYKEDDSKTIINISSRASQPNISKGYLYAAQKAALLHLNNNLVYNSDKRCRITTMNLGLLNHTDLPSISHNEVASWIYSYLTTSKHVDIPEITLQNRANYMAIQRDKETLRELERYTK